MDFAQKLLAAEILLKLTVGVVLVFVPVTTAKVLGLPHGNVGLWQRLLGAVLIGLAGALYAELRLESARGLGLVGLIIINLCTVAVLLAIAVLTPVATRRGVAGLWLMVLLLFCLSLAEILAV